jgi:ureidoacrylate peracid hydrolase
MDDEGRIDLRSDRTALLVVDVQNDFCHPNGYFAGSGFDVGPCSRVVELIAENVAALRERGIPVVWTMSTNADPPRHRLLPLRFRRYAGERPPDQFTPGSWGWQIVDRLEPHPDEIVVRKPRYDAFLRTSLEEDLRSRGVDTVVITGVITNCCVDSTARSAFMRGFDVLVVEDCVATFAEEYDLHEASLRNLSLLFAVVRDSAALREAVIA